MTASRRKKAATALWWAKKQLVEAIRQLEGTEIAAALAGLARELTEISEHLEGPARIPPERTTTPFEGPLGRFEDKALSNGKGG